MKDPSKKAMDPFVAKMIVPMSGSIPINQSLN